LEKPADDIGNGRFLVRQLGAERYLEPETVAVLITLRQALIADVPRATAADIMIVDAAVIAYYNMLRLQAGSVTYPLSSNASCWRGAAERIPRRGSCSEDRGPDPTLGGRAPALQDRAARMMLRSLSACHDGVDTARGQNSSQTPIGRPAERGPAAIRVSVSWPPQADKRGL
jgi:hypothetical protein